MFLNNFQHSAVQVKHLIEWLQAILIFLATVIFLVIAFDNEAYGKEKKITSEISAIVNPAFKYRSIYAREVHNLVTERSDRIRAHRLNFKVVLEGKDAPALISVIRRLELSHEDRIQVKKKYEEYRKDPSSVILAEFLSAHPTMLEAFQDILRDREGITFSMTNSKYASIARIMGLRVIPIKTLHNNVWPMYENQLHRPGPLR